MEDYKTRPIGEVFTHTTTLEVVKVNGIYCGKCHFHTKDLDPNCIYKTNPSLGYCNSIDRTDGENVIFKLLIP